MRKNPLCLGRQVDLFKKSVKEYLPSLQMYNNKAAQLSGHIAKSLFIVHMGSDDYLLNYFVPNGTTAQQYNPEQFADLLVTELGKSLQDLYNLGARKLSVFGISPLGCLPCILDKMKTETRCVESLNDVVKVFNTKLEAKLKELGSTLKGSTFIMGNIYTIAREILENPSSYG
ncbi:GDSL esterase/lipase 7-like [Cornus florida]|uniref:GDSL esterase/lipase 7-like n=1 Tax=Cornus florida TaxID=4283 RepID=UPI0028A04EC1|nr:GDSL esterase/lipase 7-like [Cornus florida]